MPSRSVPLERAVLRLFADDIVPLRRKPRLHSGPVLPQHLQLTRQFAAPNREWSRKLPRQAHS